MDIFGLFNRDRPTDSQKRFLKDLKVKKKPKTKDEATALIEDTIGNWDSYFSIVFPSWCFAPRIVTRHLQICARLSDYDDSVRLRQNLDPEFLREFVIGIIGYQNPRGTGPRQLLAVGAWRGI